MSHHITSLSKNQFGILIPTCSFLCLFSFFIFFFFYPELSILIDPSLLLHKPPPSHQSSPSRATTTRSVQAQPRLGLRFFFSLSLSSLCQIGFSLRHYFSLSSLLPYRYHHEQPPQATMRSVQAQPRSGLRCFSLSFLPL